MRYLQHVCAMNRVLLFNSFVMLSAISCTPSFADLPLFTTEPGRTRDLTEMRGLSFELAQDITVTGLAKFDGNQNGVLDDLIAPQVGIWNSVTSELLVSTILDEATVLRDGMFVKPIDPFHLPAGNYTLAAQFFNNEEQYIYRADFASSAMLQDVVALRERGSEFTIPTRSTPFTGFGPNMVIEQPLLTMSLPAARSVVQRRADNRGSIRVEGGFDQLSAESVEVRAVPIDGNLANATPWKTLATSNSLFQGQIDVTAGRYQVQARARKGDETIGSLSIPKVGVGEVFVIAGQSNSANHGQPQLEPDDDRVSNMDAQGIWRHAADPQPVATGVGGSPWPIFGDLLIDRLDVPVGIVSVGWGGTGVDQWIPGARGPDADPLYDRLQNALELLGPDGARAVLWHQGEQDAFDRTSREEYAQTLAQVISQSRADAGYDIPWGVARAAFLPQTSLRSEMEVVAGQQLVIDNDHLVFAGPITDDLLGSEWRFDAIHFNEAGLRLHAERWLDAVMPQIVPEPTSASLLMVWIAITVLSSRRRS